jgi:hypothetical protein
MPSFPQLAVRSPVFLCRKLIRDMTSFMDPEEDYLTIVALEEETAAAESKRKKELEEAHANLKCLPSFLPCVAVQSLTRNRNSIN